MSASIWFWFLAFMITMYVVLDGFDLGVGALHLRLARTEAEREQATAAIGPVWNGNEVWLIAAGGMLLMIFPKAYAAAFSGLYLGLILVLWLLVGRGLALELRHQYHNALWHQACDAVFCLASGALAFVFGVALANVVRGVPLGRDGYFHLSLFGILNWYALLVGLLGLVVLCTHGASFLGASATGELAQRARHTARRLWWAEAALFVALAWPTYHVRHAMLDSLLDHPWRLVFPLLAVGALAAQRMFQVRAAWRRAFVTSSLFIVGLLTTMAAGLYPTLLPARAGDPYSLTTHNAAAGRTVLDTAIVWWPIALLLATVYFFVAYRTFFRLASPGRRPS
jgi:cytochrome d ubiquinol oxidase subunit II